MSSEEQLAVHCENCDTNGKNMALTFFNCCTLVACPRCAHSHSCTNRTSLQNKQLLSLKTAKQSMPEPKAASEPSRARFCQRCSLRPSSLSCDQCKLCRFCKECYEVVHKGKLANHTFSPAKADVMAVRGNINFVRKGEEDLLGVNQLLFRAKIVRNQVESQLQNLNCNKNSLAASIQKHLSNLQEQLELKTVAINRRIQQKYLQDITELGDTQTRLNNLEREISNAKCFFYAGEKIVPEAFLDVKLKRIEEQMILLEKHRRKNQLTYYDMSSSFVEEIFKIEDIIRKLDLKRVVEKENTKNAEQLMCPPSLKKSSQTKKSMISSKDISYTHLEKEEEGTKVKIINQLRSSLILNEELKSSSHCLNFSKVVGPHRTPRNYDPIKIHKEPFESPKVNKSSWNEKGSETEPKKAKELLKSCLSPNAESKNKSQKSLKGTKKVLSNKILQAIA